MLSRPLRYSTGLDVKAGEAEDIKTTVLRALDAKNPARAGLDPIDANEARAPSPDTVIFKLKYPFAGFATTMASPNCFVIYGAGTEEFATMWIKG